MLTIELMLCEIRGIVIDPVMMFHQVRKYSHGMPLVVPQGRYRHLLAGLRRPANCPRV